MTAVRRAVNGALLVLGAAAVVGCGRSATMRGQVDAIEAVAEHAEANGAVRCAPRELALAESHVRFARIELAQGALMKASHHVWIAEANAEAALALSPAQYCTDAAPQAVALPGDADGDGHLDDVDSCVQDPENWDGFQDEDGCPDDGDTDGDGRPDSVDTCILLPEDADGFLDDDGCPETDNDLDGLVDASDKCPLEPEDPDGYEDEDGCPDLDNDMDTVADLDDQCPNTPGSAVKDPRGCPTTPALVVVTDCEVRITQQIHFAYNKAVIQPESFPVLDAVVDVLRRSPDIRLEVQGHTDDRGGDAYNKTLSQKRSEAVREYLIRKGISADRLTAIGYGEEKPIVPNTTSHNRALNRRVQFIRTEGVKEGCE